MVFVISGVLVLVGAALNHLSTIFLMVTLGAVFGPGLTVFPGRLHSLVPLPNMPGSSFGAHSVFLAPGLKLSSTKAPAVVV